MLAGTSPKQGRRRQVTISTEATYENDLAIATAAATSRLGEFAVNVGDQSSDAINDALNNEWFDGIAISDWVDAAVSRLCA